LVCQPDERLKQSGSIAVSEIAAVTLANERKRLVGRFRFQIQNEATGTIGAVDRDSKDELARRRAESTNEGAQAIVKTAKGA